MLSVLAAGLLTLCPAQDNDAGFQSQARFINEEAAIRFGESIEIGSAEWEAPRQVVVDSHMEWRIRFTVGRAGMKTGGALRLATAHDFAWDLWGGTRLQTVVPNAENYLTFRASTGAELKWTYYGVGGVRDTFGSFHPWQNMNEFRLAGPALQAGDWIEVVIGDRSGGSPGVRVQPMDEEKFVQKVYVDPYGDGVFLPLREHPHVRVIATGPKEMQVIAPTDWVAGEPGWVNVWFDDGLANPADFRGEVVFESDHNAVKLPGRYRFAESDRGVRRFEGIVFERAGTYRIRARDLEGSLQAESNPIIVRDQAPEETLFWGDIHTHTGYSDGRGTPAEMYDFGRRVSALDFCSVTDHAFTVTPESWKDIADTTNQFNEPGRYVTFLAYEWSGPSNVGGDHNVYTSGDWMPIIRSANGYSYENLRMYHGPEDDVNWHAGHVEHLFKLLAKLYRNENILAIPHFGGRPGNPQWHNPRIQRQIEIFSDHRRSEDWTSTFLEKGYRIGVMASTDNHSTNAGYGVRREWVERGEEGEVFSRVSPAERGTSLIAAYAPKLTRRDVFQAIYHRATYATTGSRIVLRFNVNGMIMGGEGKVSGKPRISAWAEGTAPVKLLRIVKNGKVIHSVAPGGRTAKLEFADASGEYEKAYYYVDLVQDDGEKAVSSPVWVNWD